MYQEYKRTHHSFYIINFRLKWTSFLFKILNMHEFLCIAELGQIHSMSLAQLHVIRCQTHQKRNPASPGKMINQTRLLCLLKIEYPQALKPNMSAKHQQMLEGSWNFWWISIIFIQTWWCTSFSNWSTCQSFGWTWYSEGCWTHFFATQARSNDGTNAITQIPSMTGKMYPKW